MVVPEEDEPDDEEVYGPAWLVIEEWRRLRNDHPHQGKSLSWLVMEERILGLELAMLQEHGLTLPPEKQPLGDFGRPGPDQLAKDGPLRHAEGAGKAGTAAMGVRRVFTLGLRSRNQAWVQPTCAWMVWKAYSVCGGEARLVSAILEHLEPRVGVGDAKFPLR